jgi:hypothetical protein
MVRLGIAVTIVLEICIISPSLAVEVVLGSEAAPAGPVAIWDGIHQIFSRFLERFRDMCPLLFSCVFPS